MAADARLRLVPRPSLPPVAWCAMGLFAGVRAAELISEPGHGGLRGLGLACVGAGALLVASMLVLGWYRSTLAVLVVGGFIAGALVGGVYWAQLDAVSRDLPARGSTRWDVTVVSDVRGGTFGNSSVVRLAGTTGAPQVEAAWPKGVEPPPNGATAEVWGAAITPESPATAQGLRQEGLAGRLTVRRVGSTAWRSGPYGAIGRAREAIREQLARVPGDAGGLLASTLLGDKTRLAGTPLEADLQTAGLSHFEAASGFHIVLVMAVIGWCAAVVVKHRRVRVAVIVLSALPFVLLAGARVPVVRGWSAAVLAGAGWDAGRRGDGIAALAAVAAAFICAAPASVYDSGFGLSVLGVAGILVFARLGEAWLSAALPRGVRAVSAPVAVTLCAVFATLPIVASVFGEVSLVAPLANLLAAPLVAALLLLGLVGVGAGALWRPAGAVVLLAAGSAGNALSSVAGWCARIPHAAVPVAASPAPLALWGASAIVLWAVWPAPRVKAARWAGAAGAVALLCLALGLPDLGPARIVVMDVGQGDAILVADRGHDMLVDTGPSATELRSALARQRVRSLDGGVVLTHFHADHVGGLTALRGLVTVPVVYVPAGALAKPSAVYDDARQVAAGQRVEELIAGDRLVDGSIALDVVSPLAPVHDPATNEASVVAYARHDGASVLLTGDAESSVLEAAARADGLGHADVLKVGHHGSAIALSEDLLGLLSPTSAVISVGAGNRYGHPRPEPLSLLGEHSVPVYRTDRDGDVTITFARSGVTVSAAHPVRVSRATPLAPRLAASLLGEAACGCATLSFDPAPTSTTPQEPDARLALRSQAGLPHSRNRGPPPGTGARPSAGARRAGRRPELQLREFRGRECRRGRRHLGRQHAAVRLGAPACRGQQRRAHGEVGLGGARCLRGRSVADDRAGPHRCKVREELATL